MTTVPPVPDPGAVPAGPDAAAEQARIAEQQRIADEHAAALAERDQLRADKAALEKERDAAVAKASRVVAAPVPKATKTPAVTPGTETPLKRKRRLAWFPEAE